ncbi:hypothetical protein PVK06_021258 [Gossypium arboreum]|uniref:Reverse transcriptase n=1 Tax=Gossypium arboreum TaxID=29729 RepID=A0ABR0PPH7_GOSAR|nr:hypothetical protein PVK06_021258 [Gossypium arboreum]
METKVCKNKMERIRHRYGYMNGLEVDPVNTRGGLCLAWRNDICIELSSFSKRHIDVVVEDKEFTWERGNLPETNIQERLDRGVANDAWMSLFLDVTIQHMPHSFSDHCPLLITTRRVEKGVNTKVFKFEAWWIMEESFNKEVKNLWESSSGSLFQKLDILKEGLRRWASQIRFDRRRRKDMLTARLSELEGDDRDDINLAELIDCKIQLNFEIEKDERYWEQWARINWLKFGDKNTAFFHSQATQRKRKKIIHKLNDEEGGTTESFKEIEGIARSYFQNLFLTDGRGTLDHLLSSIEKCISEEENQDLLRPYSVEELKEALFAMGPTKTLGEDGFPALFYQNCWHIIREDVTKFCLQILNEGMDFQKINATQIILIPKIDNPTTMMDFRLISLCNVLYKIIAKSIVNRLRGVIGKCIDGAQSAFVPGRLISDNILLAYEILHTFKQKRTGKKRSYGSQVGHEYSI